MSVDVFLSLDTVRRFLEDTLASAAPEHLRSDVRAAAKLLAEAAGEIDALPALLDAEARAMATLSGAARAALGEPPSTVTRALASPPDTLRAQLARHENLKQDAQTLLLRLQARLRAPLPADARAVFEDLARRYYALFAAQAQARLPWQSVFPTT